MALKTQKKAQRLEKKRDKKIRKEQRQLQHTRFSKTPVRSNSRSASFQRRLPSYEAFRKKPAEYNSLRVKSRKKSIG